MTQNLKSLLMQLRWLPDDQRAELVRVIEANSLAPAAQVKLQKTLQDLLKIQADTEADFFRRHPQVGETACHNLQTLVAHLNQAREHKVEEAEAAILESLDQELNTC